MHTEPKENSQVNRYGRIARWFHWASAAIIIAMFALGLWMMQLSFSSPWAVSAPNWHKSVGILLVIVTVARVLWKLTTKSPSIEGKRWERNTAHIVHWLMYVDLFVLFFSGYVVATEYGDDIRLFDWITLPGVTNWWVDPPYFIGEMHLYAAWAMITMTVVHVLAALKHHLIDHDNTLIKMRGVK